MNTRIRETAIRLAFTGLFILPAPSLHAACTISASGVMFDIYSPFSTSPEDSAGEVIVDCDTSTAYTIALDPGNGSYGARYLSGPEDQLYYNLYVDVNRLTVWGDSTGGTAVRSGSEAYESHTVYARIESGQNVRPGSYQDSIVVRIEY